MGGWVNALEGGRRMRDQVQIEGRNQRDPPIPSSPHPPTIARLVFPRGRIRRFQGVGCNDPETVLFRTDDEDAIARL